MQRNSSFYNWMSSTVVAAAAAADVAAIDKAAKLKSEWSEFMTDYKKDIFPSFSHFEK